MTLYRYWSTRDSEGMGVGGETTVSTFHTEIENAYPKVELRVGVCGWEWFKLCSTTPVYDVAKGRTVLSSVSVYRWWSVQPKMQNSRHFRTLNSFRARPIVNMVFFPRQAS